MPFLVLVAASFACATEDPPATTSDDSTSSASMSASTTSTSGESLTTIDATSGVETTSEETAATEVTDAESSEGSTSDPSTSSSSTTDSADSTETGPSEYDALCMAYAANFEMCFPDRTDPDELAAICVTIIEGAGLKKGGRACEAANADAFMCQAEASCDEIENGDPCFDEAAAIEDACP